MRRIGVAPVLGRWSADLALPDGTYSVTAEQGDDAGNVTRTAAQTLVVGTATPTPTATRRDADATATPTATPDGRTHRRAAR